MYHDFSPAESLKKNFRSNIKTARSIILTIFSITGCASYHLRTIPSLPFNNLTFIYEASEKQKHAQQSLVFSAPKNNSWQYFLSDDIKTAQTKEETNSTPASKWHLIIISDNEQKQIASLSSDGTVREYRLYKRIKVQLQHEAKLFDVINIEASKDLPYNELQRSAKELEEQKLWSDINMEIAERLETTLSWQVKNSK